ncbi:jg2670 [Pararge aegeria aegeria]|uniref:Jg2670 protein n=1 Tax=Pararge aegeria aegeria TaxID=348720 RepID=A0A8S4R8Y5_9NEOP|nr:jg2670 [Pararge aegeria aegeria]
MRKSPSLTPRTMLRKLQRTRQQSADRLKKLRALREKSRRLLKEVANLENSIYRRTKYNAETYIFDFENLPICVYQRPF